VRAEQENEFNSGEKLKRNCAVPGTRATVNQQKKDSYFTNLCNISVGRQCL